MSTQHFPLFNRAVVLVASVGLLIGLLYQLTSAKFRANLDFADGFLTCVFLMLSCLGIWLALGYRNRSSEQLAEELTLHSPERPDIPDSALAYRFTTLPRAGEVYVDSENGWIHFHDCHIPRRFIASAQTWYSCLISDLIGVHAIWHRGESFTIVTPEGRALNPPGGSQFDELRSTLAALVPFNHPGFSTDHPLMGMVYLAGATLGLLAGGFLTPRNAPNSALGVYLIIGAFLGTATLRGLVVLGDRFKLSIVQPLGYGTFGLGTGLSIYSLLMAFIAWNEEIFVALVSLGGVVGLAYGVRKQRRASGRK